MIPALIRRAVAREDPFEVWGTGDEVRDFLHVTDLVRGCLLVLEKHAVCDPINIGYGTTVTIEEVVHAILAAAGHAKAQVVFDSSKPTAIPVRTVDTTKARTLLGFEPTVSLDDGLTDTVRGTATGQRVSLTGGCTRMIKDEVLGVCRTQRSRHGRHRPDWPPGRGAALRGRGPRAGRVARSRQGERPRRTRDRRPHQLRALQRADARHRVRLSPRWHQGIDRGVAHTACQPLRADPDVQRQRARG